MDEQIKNIDAIKCILMMLVVMYHSMAIYAGDGWTWGPYEPTASAPIIGITAQWLNSFHIYGFTLISGYIFYYIKYEKDGYANYFLFLKKKVARLLVPYVFIAVVWVAPINTLLMPDESIVQNFVLGSSPRQLWFLLMLFWVFAIFWFISDIANRKPFLVGIIVCIAYCVGLFAPSYFCFDRGLQYLLFFYIGFIMRKCNFVNEILFGISNIIYCGYPF